MLCAAGLFFLAAFPPGGAASQNRPAALSPSADALLIPTEVCSSSKESSARLTRQAQASERPRATASEGEAAQIAERTLPDNIAVSLDHASVVDEKQLVLEFSISNRGTAPVLAIIAAHQDSNVNLRGEANSRPFRVQGISTCPGYQERVTQACMEHVPDAQWTLLEPQNTYVFQISTQPGREIESDRAFVRLRLLLRKDKNTRFQDVSFARIPLAN